MKRIRNLALLLTALSFLIVFISAYIRLSGAGLGCVGWPDCYGQLLAGGPHPHTGAVRIVHRITASLSLLLGFYLAWQCVRPTPIQPVARYAALLLALMILLTLVGLWSSDAHRVWTSFLNMLGGFGLVALSWRMVLAADPDSARPRPSRSTLLLRAGLAVLVLALALGALIGARYAAISCTSVPACAGIWWPAGEGWAALNPFVNVAAPALAGDAGGVALHLLHRYCAAAAMLLLGMAGLQALAAAATRTAGAGLLVLLLIEFALGSLTVVSGFSLWPAIGHSVGAAVLLAAGIQVLIRAKAGAA
ncbi:MAG: COX15/CtaA family protein [Sulfuritalea sp.]|nr:COX15/CtaA family protein [Sulfuritalea sp.]